MRIARLTALAGCWSAVVGSQDAYPWGGDLVSGLALRSSMPSCGKHCLVASLNASQCVSTNQTCLCGDEGYQAAVVTCFFSSCSAKDFLSSQNETHSACGVEPRNVSMSLLIITILLAALTLVVNVMRLAFRYFVSTTGLQGDDWAILPPLICGFCTNMLIITKCIPNGLGQDIWQLTPAQVTRFVKWFYVVELQYFFNMAFLKFSILLFYMRVFESTEIRGLLYGTAVFTGLYGVSFVLAGMFQCSPISYFWTKWDGQHTGHCFDVNALGWAHAGISIATDVWMLALPLSELRALRLPWRKKVGVALMFMVGIVITIFSIVRLKALVKYVNSPNVTFDNFGVFLWSTLEVNIGMICACMPVMRQILAWLLPDIFDGSKQPNKRYYFRLSKARGRGSIKVRNSALEDPSGFFKTVLHARPGDLSSQTQVAESRNGKMSSMTLASNKGGGGGDKSNNSSQVRIAAPDVDTAAKRAPDDENEMDGGEESTYLPPDGARMRFDSFDMEDMKHLGHDDEVV